MPKYDKNGKKPKGKQMKPCDKSSAGACQYNIYEDVVEKKRVNVKPMITNLIKIEEVPEMFETLVNPPHDEIKVLVEME